MNFNQLAKTWLLPPQLAELTTRTLDRIRFYSSLTAADRRLLAETRRLHNRHSGRRCFVLGSGSSIASQDLKKLQGEIVITVSNTFVHPDFALIRPAYHVTPPIMQYHGKLHELERYVKWLREMEAGTYDAEMIFHIGDKHWIEDNGLFKARKIHWVWHNASNRLPLPFTLDQLPPIYSVSETAIMLAMYLGFDEIYLLGIDHDWFNGLFVHFYDHRTQHAVKPDEKAISWVDSEFQMRRHAEIFRRYKSLRDIHQNIYNANSNPQHYLDVFPKVEYNELFEPSHEAGKASRS